jgi:hypothetical protein
MEGYQEKKNKHRISFENNLSQCKKQKKDIDSKYQSNNSSINEDGNLKKKCFSEINKISENGPLSQERIMADNNSIPISQYAVNISSLATPEKLTNEALDNIPCPVSHDSEEASNLSAKLDIGGDPRHILAKDLEKLSSDVTVQEVFGDRIQTVEYDSDEKNIAGASTSTFHDDESSKQACSNVRSIETSEIQVPSETDHEDLEGITDTVSSFSSNSQRHCYVVGSPIDQHIPAEFHPQSNADENVKIHVSYHYDDLTTNKGIESYNSGGGFIFKLHILATSH